MQVQPQCSGTLGLITGQEAVVCGFTRSVWLRRNHVKRLQERNETSCCFKGETNCSNSSYFTPCPRRLTNVLSELPHYSLGTFLCKNHLDFLDQDPWVTNHELYKPPEKWKVHTNWRETQRERKLLSLEAKIQSQEEQLKLKAKKVKKTVVEAKWVAAQLRLMAGQLDRLADQILDHVTTSS